ncbi:MAG TPA: glucoamylase family protein [Gemmatimonadales bacterium]|nr:glucoamylase family protein [Gemmatimonadales bacterium]
MSRPNAASAVVFALAACAANSTSSPPPPDPARVVAFLDTLEERTFHYFWDLTNPQNGLTPDRAPSPSFSSIAAVGFALTAYPIGVERGYVTRGQAAERTLTTLRFFWTAPQGPGASGVTGYQGFFYHFLDMQTGHRFQTVELSTIDTALLLAGVLFSQSYFDGSDSIETAIRAVADSIYSRVDWNWAQARPPAVSMGWHPETGFIRNDWLGYNEAMILYILALGSPTHPVEPAAWDAWVGTYQWGSWYGLPQVGFGPLFGHQYSHVWIDFRGLRDAYMRGHGIDYFENSRRATYAQRRYAEANPDRWKGYSASVWGLTACDGPANATLLLDGRTRQFHTYWARGASFTEITDDGTIAPTAAGGAVPFAPEIAIPALITMRETYGSHLFSTYGFRDAFNPTFTATSAPVERGTVDPVLGWFDVDYLGIDQGPILAMVENHRTGLVWRIMQRNPAIVRGLQRAGFTGGWLKGARGGRKED